MSELIPTTPGDHEWTREHVDLYVAGGLSDEEVTQFDAHARACPLCAEALEAARAADARLHEVLAHCPPAADFEDRLVRSLRAATKPRTGAKAAVEGQQTSEFCAESTAPPARRIVHPMLRRAAVGVAATLLLGCVGYAVTESVGPHSLPMPDKVLARVFERSPAASVADEQAPENSSSVETAWGERGGTPARLRASPLGPAAAPVTLAATPQEMAKSLEFQPNPTTPVPGSTAGKDRPGSDEPFGLEHGATRLQDDEKTHRPVVNIPDAGTLKLGGQTVNVQIERRPSAGAGDVTVANTVTVDKLSAPQTAPDPNPPPVIIQREQERTQYPLLQPPAAEDKEADKKPQQNTPTATATPAENKPIVAFAAGTDGPATASPPATETARPTAPAEVFQRKIIRDGDVEFEIDRFDSAFALVSKIATEEGGYVANTDSQKLPNGKVRGTVVVRVSPDRLDTLVLKLRGIGDLKTQRISAQDITKEYTDTESELKAGRAMESRLLELIQKGKGEIKDLLATEKELAVWRTKIEKLEGQMRYYNSLVSLSTLRVGLTERDIRTPAVATEREVVSAGIEAEDVEKARADAIKAIEEAKGRVIDSQLKKYDADKLTATVRAQVPPGASGALIDRLKQLGRMSRLDVQRTLGTPVAGGVSVGEGSASAPPARVERADTTFDIDLHNLADVKAREVVNVSVACADVEAGYRAILAAVKGEGAAREPIGRIVNSNLSGQRGPQAAGAIELDVRTEQSGLIDRAIAAAGEVMGQSTVDASDDPAVTRTKRHYAITLRSLDAVAARERRVLRVASRDVPGVYEALLSLVASEAAKGRAGAKEDRPQAAPAARVLASQLRDQDRNNVGATLVIDVPRSAEGTVETMLAARADAEVLGRNVTRAAEGSADSVDTKVRFEVELSDAAALPPRQTSELTLAVSDVQSAVGAARAVAEGAGGRASSADGINGRATLDVPVAAGGGLAEKIKAATGGTLLDHRFSENMQAPAGKLARAQFTISFTNAAAIAPEEGLWAQLKRGLGISLKGLSWSLVWLVVGVCLVLPFALVIGVIVSLVRRRARRRRRAEVTPPPASA